MKEHKCKKCEQEILGKNSSIDFLNGQVTWLNQRIARLSYDNRQAEESLHDKTKAMIQQEEMLRQVVRDIKQLSNSLSQVGFL